MSIFTYIKSIFMCTCNLFILYLSHIYSIMNLVRYNIYVAFGVYLSQGPVTECINCRFWPR